MSGKEAIGYDPALTFGSNLIVVLSGHAEKEESPQ
jgi:hypothetical protein